MNLKNLISYENLFQINSAYVSPREKLFFLAGGILVLLAIVLKISAILAPSPVDKTYRQKFYALFLTIGLAQLAWYWCRYENIPFFGTHFVAYLIVLVGLVWLLFILVSMLRHYKATKTVWEKEQVKLKYLPK